MVNRSSNAFFLHKSTPKTFPFSPVMASFACSLSFALGALAAAREMHVLLLRYVLHWPMELFDTTPLGRVLNRFSKDVDVLDNTLPQVLRSCLMMLFVVNDKTHSFSSYRFDLFTCFAIVINFCYFCCFYSCFCVVIIISSQKCM